MKIENVKISDLKPYEFNNRSHTGEDVEKIVKSIQKYGFNDPVGIWGDNIIVEGHGRVEACKRLGITEVPCIRLDHLTDEQRREYAIAHNATAEASEWDWTNLKKELEALDMSDFDFKFDFPKEKEKFDKRDRDYENTQREIFWADNKYGIPEILPERWYPEDWIGFSEAMTAKRFDVGVHFFLDDYRFNRVWNEPDRYVPILQRFKCALSPDFSMYTDFPKAVQIFNAYKRHWLGAYWQAHDITVIPTVCWSTEDSFEWCFDGEPKKSVVAVSTVGTQDTKEGRRGFLLGYEEMIKRLSPKTILFYGTIPDECKAQDTFRIPAFQEKWNGAKE